jgi:hypothetical protein
MPAKPNARGDCERLKHYENVTCWTCFSGCVHARVGLKVMPDPATRGSPYTAKRRVKNRLPLCVALEVVAAKRRLRGDEAHNAIQ